MYVCLNKFSTFRVHNRDKHLSNWPIQVHWFKWILECPVFNVPQLPTFHDMNCVSFWYQSSFTHWNYMVDCYKRKNNGFFSGGKWLQSFCFWLLLFYRDKWVLVLLSCPVAHLWLKLIDISSWNFHVGEE